ncbi:MAG: HepT-like ribonuclease domain-containing protein [Fusobacteriaceae bacterium]
MLQDITNDLLYVLSILESIGKLSVYTGNYSDPEVFFDADDQMPFNASLSLLINIGEASGKISDELKEKNRAIPWKIMKDFRNRVAHDYVNLDIFIVFNIIKNELPKIKDFLEDIVLAELNGKNFSMEEYEVCIGNRYYKHIDFEKISSKIGGKNE